MRRTLMVLIVFAALAAACSSPEPPERFLTAPMRLATVEIGQEKAESLHMRPVDLYNAFDLNVQKKKWKKEHENSWTIIVDGRDPSNGKVSRMMMTLTVDPQQNDAVVVKEIREGGYTYSPQDAVTMLRHLDQAIGAKMKKN